MTLAQELTAAAGRIFASGNPYEPKFATDAITRALLAPTSGSMLDRTQFDALGRAHAAEGGGRVYAIPLASFDLDFDSGRKRDDAYADEFRRLGAGRREGRDVWDERGFYPIDFSDRQTYFSEESRAYMVHESIIVPVSGAWGVLVAEEDYAVAAGSPEFIEKLLNGVTLEPDEMALIFIRRREAWAETWGGGDWPGALSTDHHLALLETMYGPTEAARLAALSGPYPGPR